MTDRPNFSEIAAATQDGKFRTHHEWVNQDLEDAYNDGHKALVDLQQEYQRQADPIIKRMAELFNLGTVPRHFFVPGDPDIDSET